MDLLCWLALVARALASVGASLELPTAEVRVCSGSICLPTTVMMYEDDSRTVSRWPCAGKRGVAVSTAVHNISLHDSKPVTSLRRISSIRTVRTLCCTGGSVLAGEAAAVCAPPARAAWGCGTVLAA